MNASFYRLPSERALDGWREKTPDGFRFVLKGSRLITHARRLDAQQGLATFLARARRLGPKLEALLWQLPPTQERDDERLVAFLRLLPGDLVSAFEFRHESWDAAPVDGLLAERGMARVAVSRPGSGAETLPGHGPVYVRFHGLTEGFAHDYSDDELRPWAAALAAAEAAGRSGWAFFNNDGAARAPFDAMQLEAMLGRPRRSAPPGA